MFYHSIRFILFSFILLFIQCSPADKDAGAHQKATNPQNVIFILSDDHRYDFMGFMNKVPFLETPYMDVLAKEGAHFKNAFVSTSLCSPSRASILTGQYTHRHGVVDNQSLVPEGTRFFPEFLQHAGYETGFIGKWHMGEHNNNPRPGFDYWASFRGQGNYWNSTFNVNGTEEKPSDSTYVTEAITDYALQFLHQRNKEKPFFLYVSHKAVHAEFIPSRKDKGKYNEQQPQYVASMYPPDHPKANVSREEYNYKDVPQWVKDQRYSWHGVDYMYHGEMDFDAFYINYCETLLGIDRSIGNIMDYLDQNGLSENTTIIYMGDNGFSFGEHGLIDKRHAYEESIRVPMLVYGPLVQEKGKAVESNVQNIDIGPTLLDIAGLPAHEQMDGVSMLPLLNGEQPNRWRDTIYYEYFWERPFPQTPTVHAVRTPQYKYIRYHGVWDLNELYDIKNDPHEMNNLIRDPKYAETAKALRERLFTWLEETDGNEMFIRPDGRGARFDIGDGVSYKGTY